MADNRAARTAVSERAIQLARHGEVMVRWVRDRRARRLRLSVSERGVRLTVPWHAAEATAAQFLAQQGMWLSEQLDRLGRSETLPGLLPFQTAALRLRDELLPVLWQPARFARLERVEGALRFDLPAQADVALARALYADFLQAEARADVGRWLPALLDGLPRAPSRFKFSPLGSLWGALNPSGMISLDLALVLAPPPVFRYVLVHELCHLLQPNHSRAFWREVEQRCADWRGQRRWLLQHGLALKAELAALLG